MLVGAELRLQKHTCVGFLKCEYTENMMCFTSLQKHGGSYRHVCTLQHYMFTNMDAPTNMCNRRNQNVCTHQILIYSCAYRSLQSAPMACICWIFEGHVNLYRRWIYSDDLRLLDTYVICEFPSVRESVLVDRFD